MRTPLATSFSMMLCACSALVSPAAAQNRGFAQVSSAELWPDLNLSLSGAGATADGSTFGMAVRLVYGGVEGGQEIPSVVSNAAGAPLMQASVVIDGCVHEVTVDLRPPSPLNEPAVAVGVAMGVGPVDADWFVTLVSRDAAPTQACDAQTFIDQGERLRLTVSLDNGLDVGAEVALDGEAPLTDEQIAQVDALLASGQFPPQDLTQVTLNDPAPISLEPDYFQPRFAGFIVGANFLDTIEATRGPGEDLNAALRYAGEFGGFLGYQGRIGRSESDSGPFVRGSIVVHHARGAVDGLSSSQIGPLSQVTGDVSVTSVSGLFGGGYYFGPSLVGGNGFSVFAGAGPSFGAISLDTIASMESGPFLHDSDQTVGFALDVGVDVPITENIGAGVRIDHRIYSFDVTTQQGVPNELDITMTSVSGFMRFGF